MVIVVRFMHGFNQGAHCGIGQGHGAGGGGGGGRVLHRIDEYQFISCVEQI